MNGFVQYWNPVGQFGIIKADDGNTYLAPAKEVDEDEVGRRFLIDGEAVSFDARTDDNGHKLSARAVSFDAREAVDTNDYHETCTIRKIGRRRDTFFGWLNRPCGSSLYFHSSDIITTGEETLHVGSQVWCKVRRNKDAAAKCWAAYDIEIICENGETTNE
jgi:cold shock CspA family protein